MLTLIFLIALLSLLLLGGIILGVLAYRKNDEALATIVVWMLIAALGTGIAVYNRLDDIDKGKIENRRR